MSPPLEPGVALYWRLEVDGGGAFVGVDGLVRFFAAVAVSGSTVRVVLPEGDSF